MRCMFHFHISGPSLLEQLRKEGAELFWLHHQPKCRMAHSGLGHCAAYCFWNRRRQCAWQQWMSYPAEVWTLSPVQPLGAVVWGHYCSRVYGLVLSQVSAGILPCCLKARRRFTIPTSPHNLYTGVLCNVPRDHFFWAISIATRLNLWEWKAMLVDTSRGSGPCSP